MQKIVLICLLLFGVTSCALNTNDNAAISVTPVTAITQKPVQATLRPASEPPLITTNYLPSSAIIQNPERGFSTEIDFDDPDYFQYYKDGSTLVYSNIRLDEYLESELPQTFLTELDNRFSSIRQGGVKIIVRFSYNDGPYPFPNPDASLDQILLHIKQLTPVLQKNADVIAWLEAGFIGAWGEWHASTNGLNDDSEAKRTILLALLDAMPSDRSILLRYPVDIMTNFPIPLSADNAFNETDQARVGFHNDCFLADENDQHTYARDGINTYNEEFTYLALSTQFVPMGGESCEYNPPRSDCPTALNEMQLFHFDEIGDGWYPQVLSAWEEQGCYAEMEKGLGYRISLTTAKMNEVVQPGGILNLSVELNNSGFSSLKNPRPVYLILEGASHFEVLLPVDPRFWMPGTSSFKVQLRLPADAPEGEYQVALWLPDAYPSLQDNPQYSVRFANEDVWQEKTGYNIIKTIRIDSLAPGDADSNANEFIVLP
jgi:hypothetical protein